MLLKSEMILFLSVFVFLANDALAGVIPGVRVQRQNDRSFQAEDFGHRMENRRSLNGRTIENNAGFYGFRAEPGNHQHFQFCVQQPHMCNHYAQDVGEPWGNPHFQGHVGQFDPASQFDKQMSQADLEAVAAKTTTKKPIKILTSAMPMETTKSTKFTKKPHIKISTTETTDVTSSESPVTEDHEFGSAEDESVESSSTVSFTSSGIPTAEATERDTINIQENSEPSALFDFGTVPSSAPISTSDVNGFPADLTSLGVPINPGLTVLQNVNTASELTESSSDKESLEDDDEGFTVDDPDDFLSSIRFRPVRFRPFQVLEIFDHPLQAYPRLAKPVRADSILSLLNNNFSDVLRDLQQDSTTLTP